MGDASQLILSRQCPFKPRVQPLSTVSRLNTLCTALGVCCARCAVSLLLQRLLRAQAVDAVTAAGLRDTKTAVCVSYSTAEQLSAAAEALGVPLTLTAGVRYCYMLPTMPATQHCQVRGQDCVAVIQHHANTRHNQRSGKRHRAHAPTAC